jgi:hypothetical protein
MGRRRAGWAPMGGYKTANYPNLQSVTQGINISPHYKKNSAPQKTSRTLTQNSKNTI